MSNLAWIPVWTWHEILGCVLGADNMTRQHPESWGLVDLVTAKTRRARIPVPLQVSIMLGWLSRWR